jgi:hypothetical protein
MAFSFLSGAIKTTNTNFNVSGYILPTELEKALGNPSVVGQVLASNTNGVRYWTSNISFAYTANNASLLGGKLEVNLNVNSAVYSTNTQFAYTANNSTYFGNNLPSYYTNATNINTGTLNEARLPSTTVIAGQYGNSSSIPVLTIDQYGRVNTATVTAVAGVTAYDFNNSNNTFTITTGDGSAFRADLNGLINLSVSNAISFSSSATVNSSVYTGTSNNAYHFGGNLPEYYTNATNINTGILSEPRLPYRMNQDVTTSANVEFKNLVLSGTLSVANGVTVITANNFSITDNMIYFNNGILAGITNISGNGTYVTFTADNNFSSGWDVFVFGVDPSSWNGTYHNIHFANATHFQIANAYNYSYTSGGSARGKTDVNPDLGFAAGYNDGTYHHAGFFRDHNSGTWKVFDSYIPEPDISVYINQSHPSFRISNFMANTIFVGNNTEYATITPTNFSGTSNNATNLDGQPSSYYYQTSNPFEFANSTLGTAFNANNVNGKSEANLNVNSAVYSTNAEFSYTANNSNLLGGKQESELHVSRADSASSADSAVNADKLNNKTEGNLSVNNAIYANNSNYLQGNPASYFYQTSNPYGFANSTVGTSNNATNLDGQPSSYYYQSSNPFGFANSTVGTVLNSNNLNGKSEANLNVNNANTATHANNSNYLQGNPASYFYQASNPFGFANSTVGTVLNSNSALFANNSNYLAGQPASSFATTTGTIENANKLNNQPATYYTNATNIITGTLQGNIIPSYVVNTSANFTLSGIFTYNANIVLSDTSALVFNTGAKIYDSRGFEGSAGQILASNGAGNVYWTSLALLANTDLFINTTASYTFTNTATHTHNANIVLNANAFLKINYGAGIIDSSGTLGSTSQILTSNGTNGVYWSTFTGGLLSGNGLNSNTTHMNVNANTGIIANSTGVFVDTSVVSTLSTTQQLTNKRVTPRVNTQVSTSLLSPDISLYDMYVITAQSTTLNIEAPIGSPSQGERLMFRIKDNGTTRTLTFDSSTQKYRNMGVTVPAATSPTSNALYIGCIYNATDDKWDIVAVANN